MKTSLVDWLRRRTGNWPITKKVLAAFGGVAIAGSAAALLIGIGVVMMADAARSARMIAKTAQAVTAAEAAVGSAQSSIKDYVIAPGDAPERKVRGQIAKGRAALERAAANIEETDFIHANQAMDGRLDALEANFARIVSAQENIEAGAGATLDELTPTLDEQFETMIEETFRTGSLVAARSTAQALRDYSAARHQVDTFRLTGSNSAAEAARLDLRRLDQSMDGLVTAVAGTAMSQAADQLARNVGQYQRAFGQVDQLTHARNASVAELVGELGPAFEADGEDLRRTISEMSGRSIASVRGLLNLLLMILGTVLIVGLFSVIIAWLVSRELIAAPIENMANLMQRLAAGERDVIVTRMDRKDEIGDMARAILVFDENAREVAAQRAAADDAQKREAQAKRLREEERQAERLLAEAEKRKALSELADSFESSVRNVASAVNMAARQIEAGARQVAGAAGDSARVSAEAAVAAQQSSQNALAVAHASEEMALSIAEVSAQVVESSAKSQNAARLARSTDTIVVGLAEDATKIGEVVDLINDIAEQTNLLALNATIEAARAGDFGRGFAVVAGEIKALASQTGKATTQIAERVGGIQAVSRDAIAAIESITASISGIDGIAATVAAAVEEQSATTSEIASNTQQAASGSQLVARNIDRVRKGIEQTGSAAEQSLSAASQLSAQAEMLQKEVDAFLIRVRAA